MVREHKQMKQRDSSGSSDSVEITAGTADAVFPATIEDTRDGPELVEGVSGYAYYFDGVGDYIDVGEIDLSGQSSFSISAWIKLRALGAFQPIVTKAKVWSDYSEYKLVIMHTNKLGFWFATANTAEGYLTPIYSATAFSTGIWYHVAGTYDGDAIRMYINGELDENCPIPRTGSPYDNRHNTWIGNCKPGRKSMTGFNGSIDEVSIFDRALSADEIRLLYRNSGRLTGNEPGLVGYWNFDNDDGDVVKDLGPHHNHGQLSFMETLPPLADFRPELTEGASGSAYYFDGDADHIDIGPIEGLGVEQTKMLWVYLDGWSPPNWVYLIDQGRRNVNNWIELIDLDANGIPEVRVGFDTASIFDSNGQIEPGYWHHIAVVSTSSGDVDIYINGLLDSWKSGFSATTQPKAVVIGAHPGYKTSCFKGVIDEVAIFNRALSDQEIWWIYQNTGRLRGFEPGLVGYWNFDYDDGDIVRDRSPYGNDGKLGGM
jgi:hypothetical protein